MLNAHAWPPPTAKVGRRAKVWNDRSGRFCPFTVVTMNSDALPRDGFAANFGIHEHVMDIKPIDATNDGGLFGLRFE